MPKVALEKVNIVITKQDRYQILELLQKLNIIHINDISEKFNKPLLDFFSREFSEFKLQLSKIEFLIDFISQFDNRKKPAFSLKPEYTSKQIEEIVSHINFEETYDTIFNISNEKDEYERELLSLNQEKENLIPWKKLDINIKDLDEFSNQFQILLFKIPNEKKENMISDFQKLKNNEITYYFQDDKYNYYSILHNKNNIDFVLDIIKKHEGLIINLEKRRGTPLEEIDRINRRILKVKNIIQNLQDKVQKFLDKLDKLKVYYDYVNYKFQQKQTRKNFFRTNSIVIIEGFINKKHFDFLNEQLETISNHFALISSEIKKDEQIPVLIQNTKLFSPAESITNMYGLPKNNELDPTPFLMPFFITFFGFSLTDAGYGFILIFLIWFIIKKFKIPVEEQKLYILLILGGIMTVILGILFGGWFGIDPELAPSWLTYTKVIDGQKEIYFLGQLINPLKNPLLVLGIALIMGYVQVIFGTFLKGIAEIKAGNLIDGLLDGIIWGVYLLLIGLFIVGTMMDMPILLFLGQWGVIGMTIILILTQGRSGKNIFAKLIGGILSLYGLVGYMSDILSYSRLLALGLATGIIAMSVNLIATLLGGMIPYVGIIITIIILICGHMFNLLLNSLGAYIHSLRLQFIEFFGKFFEGGGKMFNPFRKECKFIKINN